MIPFQRFSQFELARLRIIVFHSDCLTIMQVNVCSRKTKFVSLNPVKPSLNLKILLTRVGNSMQARHSLPWSSKHVQSARHNQVFGSDRNVGCKDKLAW